MNYLEGSSRSQVKFRCLDDYVDKDSEVRVIDKVVDTLGFTEFNIEPGNNFVTGRPKYNPRDLIKLYVYGYLNGCRSSRQLEKQARINMELRWLIRELEPKHTVIAQFRKDHAETFELMFKYIVMLCDNLGLIGKNIIAIDGTKIRANAGKSTYYTARKLNIIKQLAEDKVNEYLKQIDENDNIEFQNTIKEKIGKIQEKKKIYNDIEEKLNKDTGVSLIDPDAKRMITGNTKGCIIGYNVQTAVDSKNCLLVNYGIYSNATDQGLLYEMANSTKKILEVEEIEALADKAYYKCEDVIKCENENIYSYVKKQGIVPSGISRDYWKDKFQYDEKNDLFICPKGKLLHRRTYKKDALKIMYYTFENCQQCSVQKNCTKSKYGRALYLYPQQKLLDMIDKRLDENKEKYKRRQMIVEHPFGTIKRAMKFTYLLVRGKKSVSGEVGLISFCYNLKRLIKIKGVESLLTP